MCDHEPSDEKVEQAMDEFTQIGNKRVVAQALEYLNRVDITKLSNDQLRAYVDTLESNRRLRESLSEPEKRRPNAQVHAPYEVTDD